MRQETINILLFNATQYSLGKPTQIVDDTVEEILLEWDNMSNKFRKSLQEEIKVYLERNYLTPKRAVWNKVLREKLSC